MRNTKPKFIPPQVPTLPAQLDMWSDDLAPELDLDLEDCAVQDEDFSVVQRLFADGCKFTRVQLAGTVLEKCQLSECILSRIEAAGMRASDAAWLRVATRDSRLTGADLGTAFLEDCVFKNVKFDEAGLRFATLKRVRFEDCVLRGADFSGAKLSNVTFSGCELEGANFDNAACKAVDLRGEVLTGVKGVLGLKGATISSDQLVQLAPLLAADLGLDVDYET